MEIRRLLRGDGDQLRAVRLRALADAPYAFSSSLERELGHDARFWEERVSESELGESGAVFVAVVDDRSVAMAGGFFPDDDHAVAMLWGLWVDPLARRHGLAQELVDAVASWTRDAGAGQLRLAVTDCEQSQPVAGLYRKLGFADTGEREPLEWNQSLITRVLYRSL